MKILSFTYVYFSESGLFNGLQPIKIKKSFPVSHCVRNATRGPSPLPLSPRASTTANSIRPTETRIAHILDFEKHLHVYFSSTQQGGRHPGVAGVGVDSGPYFRLFNPVLQTEKFDSDGAFAVNGFRSWRG
jgi:FAD binding domain of DNA photolyase